MEKMKKLVLLNLPYLFIFILADRTSFLYQNSPGKVPGDKLLYLCTHSDRILGIVPSIQVKDLLIGLIVAVAAKLLMWEKQQNSIWTFNYDTLFIIG